MSKSTLHIVDVQGNLWMDVENPVENGLTNIDFPDIVAPVIVL